MTRPQDPYQVSQYLLGKGQRPRGVAALAGPCCDVVPGDQGAEVVGAENVYQVRQQVAAPGAAPLRSVRTRLSSWRCRRGFPGWWGA